MLKFIDYIFYRAYIAYGKKNDPALFNSILYISSIVAFLFIPVLGLVYELFRNDQGTFDKIIFAIYFIVALSVVAIRYSKKGKVDELIKVYNASCIDDKIPKWLTFMVLPISMMFGILLLILTQVYMVKPLHIEGYLFRMFFD